MSDFSHELADATTNSSFLDRNPDQKTRVYMIDLLQYAETRNLSFPDYISDHIRKCFDNDNLSYKEATNFLEKLSDYAFNRGYSWQHDVDISVYSSETEKFKAIIKESLDELKTPVYTAILSDNGKENQICRSHEYTDCQKKIGEHFFMTALHDLSKTVHENQLLKDLLDCAEKQIVKDLVDYAENQRIKVPEKTQLRWEELLKSGEKIENIKNYIDEYSKSIYVPVIEKPKVIDKVKDLGMDI